VIMKVYHDLRRSCDVVGDWGQWSTTMLSFCRKPQNIQYTWEGKKEKNLKECVCVWSRHTHIKPLRYLYVMTSSSYKNTQETQTWKQSWVIVETQKKFKFEKNQVPMDIDEKFRYLGVKSSSYRYT
jgi:hypothetical protein